MPADNQIAFVKLQSGERFDVMREESLPSILEKLHPGYNARATFHLADEEWLSVFGCVSEGFAISFKAPGQRSVAYCPKMLSFAETRSLLAAFLRRDPDWKKSYPWKRAKPVVNVIVCVLVIVVVVSILVLFLRDLLRWG